MDDDSQLQKKREILSSQLAKMALDRIEKLKHQYCGRSYPVKIHGRTISSTFETACLATNSPQPGNIEIHLRVSPQIVVDDLCYVHNELGELCFGIGKTIEPVEDDGNANNKALIVVSDLKPSSSQKS